MDNTARPLIITGLGVAIAGVALLAASRLGLGRLPGDIAFHRGNAHIAIPIATSILLSIVLTIALNIAIRVWL